MNKLKQHIESNIKFLSEFNKKWFDSEAPFFKSLDLNWEDIENEVKQVKFNSNGIREEIEFKDGSMIQFNLFMFRKRNTLNYILALVI